MWRAEHFCRNHVLEVFVYAYVTVLVFKPRMGTTASPPSQLEAEALKHSIRQLAKPDSLTRAQCLGGSGSQK